MDKIDFVNSTQPALNDTNLNLMQDNIERAINAQVSGDTLPIGSIIPFPGISIPENWLLCDGRAISRTTYSNLFNVIGTTYGVGDGSTTFNIPNLKGRVPVGQDSSQTEFNNLGKKGGEKTHTLSISEMPSHNHNVKVKMNASGFGDGYLSAASGYDYSSSSSPVENKGGGQAHNNLQPYIVQKFIIKANQTAGTVAQILDTYSTSTTDGYSADYINSKMLKVFTIQFTLGTFTPYQDKYDQTYTITNTDIPANYTPIGIVGQQIYGTYSSHCTYTSLILQSARTVFWGVKNNTDVSTGSLGTNLKILAIKNS